MKKNVLFLTTLLLFVGISLAINPSHYYPMTVGNTWVYDVTGGPDGDYTETNQVTHNFLDEGYQTYVSVNSNTLYPDEPDTSLTQIRENGVYIYMNLMDEETGDYLKFIPNPFDIGESWTVFAMDTNISEDGFDYHIEFAITMAALGYDDVSVAAGSFDNCIHLLSLYESIYEYSYFGMTFADTTCDTTYMWAARDIGIVKIVEDISYEDDKYDSKETSELVSFTCSNVTEKFNSHPEDITISAYPNPFNGAVSIVAPEGSTVSISDLNGRTIEHYELSDNESHSTWIPSDKIHSGTYIVNVTKGNSTKSEKIIYLK